MPTLENSFQADFKAAICVLELGDTWRQRIDKSVVARNTGPTLKNFCRLAWSDL